MIKLEIIDSTDPLTLGVYNYLYDKVFIGRSKKCDLVFIEKGLPLKYVTLSVLENSLIAQSEPDSPAYFINGKKSTGSFKLKKNDVLTIGAHQIKILDYKKTYEAIDLTPFYEKISSASPEIKEALAFIEEKLLLLEEAK